MVARLTVTRRSRVLGILVLLSLASAVLAAAPMAAQEAVTDLGHCRVYTPASGAAQTCELSGRQIEVGVGTFEPTIGADGDGNLYYARADRENGVAIGFGAGIAKSADGGETWEDVTPEIAGEDMPPETNDPMIYVDPGTGRVFQFHMSPILTCSIMSFSDDAGETWTTNPFGCGPTAVWDHQTMVAAKPRTLPTDGYPNVLHQCVNSIYAAMCSRSLDGGLTWSPGTPAYFNENGVSTPVYGAQHGHLVAGPDGTVYLPSPMMATVPTVWVSRDDGLTWERSVIAEIDIPFTDPAVAVDGEGNVYATFVDEAGTVFFAHSTDQAQTWSDAVAVAPGVTGTMPAMVAGDAGHVAIAYPGTDDLPAGFATPDVDVDPNAVEWGGYLTVTTNGLDGAATFTTVNTTGDDPLMRRRGACANGGRCAYQVDFIGATLTPDGQVFASLADGCTHECTTDPESNNNESHGRGVAITIDAVSLCAEQCARFSWSGAVDEFDQAAVEDAPPSAADVDFGLLGALAVQDLWAEADRRRKALASGTQP